MEINPSELSFEQRIKLRDILEKRYHEENCLKLNLRFLEDCRKNE